MNPGKIWSDIHKELPQEFQFHIQTRVGVSYVLKSPHRTDDLNSLYCRYTVYFVHIHLEDTRMQGLW